MRKRRLVKKLHNIWLIDVASDVVMDRNMENILWGLNQGDTIELNAKSYFNSPALTQYDLEINLVRGPIEGHWLNQKFSSRELSLYFYAAHFPNYAHGWTLFEEDRKTR